MQSLVLPVRTFMISALALALVAASAPSASQVMQLTSSPKNHDLDNNDNFSPDDRLICYDTRETYGPGIENCRSIEMVAVDTGDEILLYAPEKTVTGDKAAPGVGAVSFSHVDDKVAFIHGPPVDDVPDRGYYAKPNRTGVEVRTDEAADPTWLDYRDVATNRDTFPGAHRGGTHRHEYSRTGNRIGFTYDDSLLPLYGRTVGYMEPHDAAPMGATHYVALLVPVVPEGTARPGELEMASGDSWVDPEGTMRAFIGKVREEDGSYEESLFVVDVPLAVDITTADSGSADRYPQPPEGVRIRRLTHSWAGGIVRGSPSGDRIAYYGKSGDGTTQVFVIPSRGSDRAESANDRPVQVTHIAGGVETGLRWHPSGNYVAYIANNRVAVTSLGDKRQPGDTEFLTPPSEVEVSRLVWSQDGARLAFNMRVPTFDARGERVYTYDNRDFMQIFLVPFPGRSL